MNKDEAKKLADLARIEVADTELEKIATEIGSILGYVDKIKSAEFSANSSDDSAESRAENAAVRNVMIADENPHDSGIYTKKVLAEAPNQQDDMVKVKKILK